MIYLDLPLIHYHTEEGFDMLDALKDSNNVELFGRAAVQVLIDKHWER